VNAISDKLYYSDPWLQKVNTVALSCEPAGENYEVVLRETIFYPTGGGQPHDLGSINGVPLLDVILREDEVYHVLSSPITPGPVECVLDWDRRLDHMQQHTGQHLLSAVLLKEYGYATESFHLGAEYSSIDISTSSFPVDEQTRVEEVVNSIIFQNVPIHIYWAAQAELDKLPLRKVPDLEGDLRIVEISGWDLSPCSGTHLSSTGQLSLFKLLRTENYKGMIRVYFLCGTRAFRDYQSKHAICSELGAILSVPIAELPTRTEQELNTKRELEREIAELKTRVMELHAQTLVSSGGESPLVAELPTGSLEDAKLLANSVLNLGTFSVVVKLQNHLFLAHNRSDSLHCGQLVKELALPLGGRGGGSPSSAQVFFPEQEGKEEFFRLLLEELK
jgi:alanyl-tRNA synthetase